MKYCSACGQVYEQHYDYCEEDGSPLVARAASPRVLYCPACAVEYPLTFSACPVDGLPLSARNRSGSPAFESKPEGSPLKQAAEIGPVDVPAEKLFLAQRDFDESTGPAVGMNITVPKDEADRPGFQIAAMAIVFGLVFLATVAAYTVLTQLSHTPAQTLVEPAIEAEQPLEFIPTPQAAFDYREEEDAAASPAPSPREIQSKPEADSKRDQVKRDQQKRDQQSRSNAAIQDKSAAQPAPTSVDANLVRVRSRRTATGVRYDLTFNLREKAGRAIQWEKLLIATSAASGMRHSESTAFPYRLGASAVITFTVSVEMPGASEPDWQGRIICTGIGRDHTGKLTRATFGATVSR